MGIAVWRFVGWGIWLCEFLSWGRREGRVVLRMGANGL